MIKVSYKHINEHPIEEALNRLSNMPLSSLKSSYTVAKLRRMIMDGVNEKRKACTAALLEIAEKDEKGAPMRNANGGPLVTNEAYDANKEKLEALLEGELVVAWRPLQFFEIAECRLSANELQALAPLIQDLETAMEDTPSEQTDEAAKNA